MNPNRRTESVQRYLWQVGLALLLLVLVVVFLLPRRNPSHLNRPNPNQHSAPAHSAMFLDPAVHNPDEPGTLHYPKQTVLPSNPSSESNWIIQQISSTRVEPSPGQDSPASTNPASAPFLELIWIKPGSFMMGSPENEKDRRSNEGPQTEVVLTYEFWAGKFEVTCGQYKGVIGKPDPFWNPFQESCEDQMPLPNVCWNQAMAFCKKLTELEMACGAVPHGYEFRLPTEAEWEYVCRAGTTTRFSFGDDPDSDQWLHEGWIRMSPNASFPHWVGTRQPNPWGVYHMHDNVRELCLDSYGNHYPGGRLVNPMGAFRPDWVTVRGGSQGLDLESCRSAFRQVRQKRANERDVRVLPYGFRIVLGPKVTL